MEADENPKETNEKGKQGGLSHVQGGAAHMVDVGAKPATPRSALARARMAFPPGTLGRVLAGEVSKGAWPAIEEVARSAGILAAKRTETLIPMCHSLGLDHVEIVMEPVAERDEVEIRCRASCNGRTGVEMEALTGASVAALTVYDMTKSLGHGIRILALELLEKSGGRSGTWRRDG